MKKYRIIRLTALAVFIAAFCCWSYNKLLYISADYDYKDLQKKTVKTIEPEAAEEPATETEALPALPDDDSPVLDIDHSQLSYINEDYVCWLSACNDRISYPVAKGETNDEYLHKTFLNEKNFVGCIFMDHRCGLSDFHTLLYGHSMHDGSMFRLIAEYPDYSFYEKYPYFYVYTPEGRQRYTIFSVYDVNDDDILTALGEKTDEEKTAFVAAVKQRSLYDIPVTPTPDNKIISLVTCDVRNGRKRVVVNGADIG